MAEEIEDNGFYREDFSAVSEWEIFNAQLCELFQKWKLSDNDWGRLFQPNELFECDWEIEEKTLYVKGNEVLVTYYKADLQSLILEKTNENISMSSLTMAPMHEDLLSLCNTFGPKISDFKSKQLHWLARFYGLRRFVVLKPRNDQNSFITKRSEFSFYISAISVVTAELCSSVPVFVQIYDQKWNFFLGQGITSCMRTNFDLVALEKPPKYYCYLSGLRNMFKEKLPKNCKQPVLVSVRNTYSLETVKLRVPMYVPFGLTPLVDEERSIVSLTYFTALPHGYYPDSHTESFAVFTWPELMDNMVIDTVNQTDFVPSKARCGEVCQVVHATSYLTACIYDYDKLLGDTSLIHYYVGPNVSATIISSELSNSFDCFENRHLITFQTDRKEKIRGPITDYVLNQMIFYLFPNLQLGFPYEDNDLNKDPHRIKSAVADSLVQRISCLLATCYSHFGGNSGMAQLWATFIRVLYIFWESGTPIPGIAKGFPDTRTCLLHQKFQMLNVCIERRLQREDPQKFKAKVNEDDEESDTEEEEEEEFYDCYDSPAKDQTVAVATKPEGRLKRLRNLKLLDSEDYLYVPITQEAVPKTEDEIQDEADILLELGSSSDYVTAMMCATLQSDTEAFKAANLNAKFEDFIRWYSPNDWEEYEDDQGVKQYKLSARMKVKGNTWQTVWEKAKPVPAARQKSLFDDTKKGEEVLLYLETRSLGEIYALTVVPLFHSAILKLKNIFLNADVLEVFSDSLEALLANLSCFSHTLKYVAETPQSLTYEKHFVMHTTPPSGIISKIERLEIQFYQYKCLEILLQTFKLNPNGIQEKFKEILKNKGSFSLMSDDLRKSETWNSFTTDMIDKLINKDYVIRVGGDALTTNKFQSVGDQEQNANMPILPQFLRAIVTGEELRLCGAFTESTTILD